MADKSEKPSKADKILEAMDDLSAAVDGFAARLQSFEVMLDKLNNDLVSVYNKLADVQIDGEATRTRLVDVQVTVDTMNDRLEDVAKISENLEENFPYFQEVADDIRRRERQEQLFEARAAMGKVKFISMRA